MMDAMDVIALFDRKLITHDEARELAGLKVKDNDTAGSTCVDPWCPRKHKGRIFFRDEAGK